MSVKKQILFPDGFPYTKPRPVFQESVTAQWGILPSTRTGPSLPAFLPYFSSECNNAQQENNGILWLASGPSTSASWRDYISQHPILELSLQYEVMTLVGRRFFSPLIMNLYYETVMV